MTHAHVWIELPREFTACLKRYYICECGASKCEENGKVTIIEPSEVGVMVEVMQ